jgi:DNA modification methylase
MTKPPTKAQKEKSKLTKEEWREYTKTVWQIANTSDPNHPAVFPVEIPRRLIKLFSFHGETVLDPFAGTGTTAVAAIELGRHGVCIEQNTDYAEIIRNRCHALSNGREHAQVILGDSRNMEILAADSVGLVVTSPPYWNKADYGKGDKNVGNEPIYKHFFEGIRFVFEECYRVLMPGRKLCIVTANVNQHTEHGLLTFPLAADFICQLRDIGFVLVNEIIWSKDGTGGKWGSHGKQRPIFGSYPYPPNFLFKNVHEYIVIVAKPPSKKANGKTVVFYDYLMGRSGHGKTKVQHKGGRA